MALEAEGVDLDEIVSTVCNSLDRSVGQIIDVVERRHGVRLGREQPYEIVRRAATEGRLQYDAPVDSRLSYALIEGHEWLKRVRVVRTSMASDVARHAARLLLDLVVKWERPDLHIGFAGGSLMAETVRSWAGFLKFSGNVKLKRLYVHALIAAAYDPRRSLNGFVQWLLDDSLPFKTFFVGLPTPAFLSPSGLAALRRMEGVRDVFADAQKLDMVVTSAGAHWAEDHSGLNRQLAELSPESLVALKRAGCIGDVLWQPFGSSGPMDAGGLRAVTLVDLADLPQLVRSGKRVMLVLAPCGSKDCGAPKDAILKAILDWRDGVTDVVVDARAASLVVPPAGFPVR